MAVIRPAVFLDLDGTLVEHVPDNVDPARVALARGVGGALRALKAHGYSLLVVSNQPGVAAGRLPLQALERVERRIQELLGVSGVSVDAFYYCPHLPQTANDRSAVRCLCRKPQPGLLRRAALDWQIDLQRSWLVGAILDDVEAGNRAGCRSVLLHNGSETEWRLGAHREPDDHARSLRQAAQVILTAAGHAPHGPAGADDALDATRPIGTPRTATTLSSQK
jgi:histidinol-phosphate phosphatase family protein